MQQMHAGVLFRRTTSMPLLQLQGIFRSSDSHVPWYGESISQWRDRAGGECTAMINHYYALDDVLAWKMPGAVDGGYLAMVVKDSKEFIKKHDEAIYLQIRRA